MNKYHVKCETRISEIALSGRTIVAKIIPKNVFKEIPTTTYLCKIEIHGIWYFYHPTTYIKCTDAIQKFSNFPLLWQNICTLRKGEFQNNEFIIQCFIFVSYNLFNRWYYKCHIYVNWTTTSAMLWLLQLPCFEYKLLQFVGVFTFFIGVLHAA